MSRPQQGSQSDAGHDHPLIVATLAIATLAFATAFWPVALGRVFLYADLGNFHLPLRMFWAESLANGTSALWIPNLFSGFYLHGEGQVGMYHPLHWLLYRGLPLQPAFALEGMLTYPFAGVGMFWFLRRLTLPKAAAAFGGLTFALSSFLMLRLTHLNVIAVIAHIPWLFAVFDVAALDARARTRALGWIGISLLVASQVLLGYPGAIAHSLLFLGLYALFVCARARRVAPIAWLGAAVLLGLLLGAIQLIPTFDLFESSVRENTSLEFRMRGSLHPANLLQLLLPYAFSQRVFDPRLPNPVELSFYFGAIVPIASIWLATNRRRLGALRGFVLAATGACAIALVLALGEYGGLYALLSGLPLVGQLPVPARFTLLLYIVGAAFTAIAFADLARDPKTRSQVEQEERTRDARWIWLAPALGVVLAAGAMLARNPEGPPGIAAQIASPAFVWTGPGLSLLCAALFFAAARGARIALVGLALFVAMDQTAYGASEWWTVEPKTLDDYIASIPRLPAPPSSRVAMLYSDYAKVGPEGDVLFHTTTPFIVHDIRLVRGYTGLIPARNLPPKSAKTMQVAAVSHWQNGKVVVPFPNALPRFRFVSDARTTQTPARDMQSSDVDVARTAFVDEPVDLQPGAPGEIVAAREIPGEIRLTVTTPTQQLLVVSETFHPGWLATVDGTETRMLRAYGDFMALVVPAGKHRVVLRFEPKSFSQGRVLSIAGLCVLAVALLAALRPRKNA